MHKVTQAGDARTVGGSIIAIKARMALKPPMGNGTCRDKP